MNYKTQSIITIAVIAAIMISIGVVVGTVGNDITGAVVKEGECYNDADCNDNNSMTEDICLYAESCSAAKCINKKK